MKKLLSLTLALLIALTSLPVNYLTVLAEPADAAEVTAEPESPAQDPAAEADRRLVLRLSRPHRLKVRRKPARFPTPPSRRHRKAMRLSCQPLRGMRLKHRPPPKRLWAATTRGFPLRIRARLRATKL